MNILKPDSLLPFAIAAILGFLVLGLNGGRKPDSSKVPESSEAVESIAGDKDKVVKSSRDLRVQMTGVPGSATQ
jgi:hypothetical protein